MEFVFLACFIIGLFRGLRILRETHQGKFPGVKPNESERDVWIFLDWD